MKEADEHVRFAVPPSGSSACLPHCLPWSRIVLSLYVTANKPAGGKNKTQIKHFPGSV